MANAVITRHGRRSAPIVQQGEENTFGTHPDTSWHILAQPGTSWWHARSAPLGWADSDFDLLRLYIISWHVLLAADGRHFVGAAPVRWPGATGRPASGSSCVGNFSHLHVEVARQTRYSDPTHPIATGVVIGPLPGDLKPRWRNSCAPTLYDTLTESLCAEVIQPTF